MNNISSSFFIPREKSKFANVFKRVRILPLYSFPHFKDMNYRITEHRNRYFVHIDFDAFYAQVEQRDNPKLRGKPVSVGGTENGKGIVMTASYEARAQGVYTGSSVWKAKQLCPLLVSLPCHGEKYEGIMQSIMHLLEEFVPADCIEQYSIDECFIDITPIAKNFQQALDAGKAIKKMIREKENLTTSMGISYNKTFAKLATNLEKPDGLTLITKENKDRILSLPAGKLWGIGRRTELRMNVLGIRTINDLACCSIEGIRKEFGINGIVLRKLARGEDTSGIHRKEDKQKCFNHHHSLMNPVYEPEAARKEIRRVCEYICRKMRSAQLVAKYVALTVRFTDLSYRGGKLKLSSYTNDAAGIYDAAVNIFERLEQPSRDNRAGMFGITVFDMHTETKDTNLDLFRNEARLPYGALDSIKTKYGESIIRIGLES